MSEFPVSQCTVVMSYRLCTLIIAFLVWVAPALAAVTLNNTVAQSGISALQLPYFEDRTGSNSPVQASVQFSRFQQSGQNIASNALQFAPTGGFYWIDLSLANNTRNEQWFFELQPGANAKLSAVKSLSLYDPANPSQKPMAVWPDPQNSRATSLPVTIQAGQSATRYVLVETWPGMTSPMTPVLMSQQYQDQQSIDLARKTGMLWLIMGAICGIGLVQLILTRQGVQGMLALNALIVGAGTFLLQHVEIIPGIATYHPVFLPLAVDSMIGIGASLMLWVGSRRYGIQSMMCLLPLLLNVLVFALGIFKLDIFTGLSFGVDTLPSYLLSATGLILAVTTMIVGLANISIYWFLPAWMALMAMPWAATLYPFAASIAYVIMLGVAGVASVFTYWRAMDNETTSLQRRLRQELKNIKEKFQTEDENWNKKMETQRDMLNELRAREQQRSAELEIAKKEADAANKAKSDFLAIISHEIRTPMNGIMGIVQILDQTVLDDKQREYIDVIKNSGDTMVTLLNDILDYSKIEKGVIDLENIPFSLRKLVQSVATLMSGRAKDKGLSILVDIDASIHDTLSGDPSRIRQILLNLASNAIKFTEKGSVTIRVTATSNAPLQLRFEVIDTGMGISEEAQSRLFQAYVQADSSISRRFGGTGLGLNICRMLVNAMKGDIGVTSVENHGSTFWFVLPLETSSVDLNEHRKEYGNDGYHPQRKLYILAIDDNEVNLKIVSSLLEMDGHQVVSATSGEQALQLIDQDRFDMVFVDMLMPGMDGKAFLKQLRQNPHPVRAGLPVFALTGLVSAEDRANIIASGMIGVISKPVTNLALRQAIDIVNGSTKTAHEEIGLKDIMATLDQLSEAEKEKLRAVLLNASAAPAPITAPIAPPVSVTPPEVNVPMLNMTMMNDLKSSLPHDTVVELFDDLIKKSKELTEQLIAANDAGDYAELGEKAHNIRGMAGNFGLQGLMEHSGKIEDAVRAGDNEKAAALTQSSRHILEQSLTQLDQWLKS